MKFTFLFILFLLISTNSGKKKKHEKKHEKKHASPPPPVPQDVQLKEKDPEGAATFSEYTCSPGVGTSISPSKYALPNFDDCSEQCSKVENCVGFDYATKSTQSDACRLFKESGIDHQHANNPESRKYCGRKKKLIDYTCQQGQGSDAIKNLNFPDRFECATRCDEVVDCFSFDYIEHDDQESCRLFGHQTIINTEENSIRIFCKNEQRKFVAEEPPEISAQVEVAKITPVVAASSSVEENKIENKLTDNNSDLDENKIQEQSTSTKSENKDEEKNNIDDQLKMETNTKHSVPKNVGAAAAMTFISITSFVLFGGVVFKMWIKNQQKKGAGVSLLGEDEI